MAEDADEAHGLENVYIVAILNLNEEERADPEKLSRHLSKLFGQEIDVAGPWKNFSIVFVIEGEPTEIIGKFIAVGRHAVIT